MLAAFAVPRPSSGQSGDDPAVTILLRDFALQQAAIADNQTKIDAKIAEIAVDVGQARIFAARGK